MATTPVKYFTVFFGKNWLNMSRIALKIGKRTHKDNPFKYPKNKLQHLPINKLAAYYNLKTSDFDNEGMYFFD